MYITMDSATREDWDNVKSWNYKLKDIDPKKSVVYAEVSGEHGEVTTGKSTWIYYVLDGEGEFYINSVRQSVKKGDVITVPPNTSYNYFGSEVNQLKVVMVIDLWDN